MKGTYKRAHKNNEMFQHMAPSVCSHTFTLFWLRKTSVSVEIYQLSVRVLFWIICAFHLDNSSFVGRNFSFLFVLLLLSAHRYFPFLRGLFKIHSCFVHWQMSAWNLFSIQFEQFSCVTVTLQDALSLEFILKTDNNISYTCRAPCLGVPQKSWERTGTILWTGPGPPGTDLLLYHNLKCMTMTFHCQTKCPICPANNKNNYLVYFLFVCVCFFIIFLCIFCGRFFCAWVCVCV